MELKIFQETDSEQWNKIIDSTPTGTIFHRWEWLRIAEKHSKSKLYPLAYLDDCGEPFGVFPLFYAKRGPLKMVFSPPPSCMMRLGPALTDNKLNQHKREYLYNGFHAQVESFIKNLGTNYISILTSQGLMDTRPFQWSGYEVRPSYTYIINLTQGEGNVWSNLGKYLRKNIRRAERRGVSVVERACNDDIEYVYESLNRRYKDQKMMFTTHKQYLHDVFRQFGSSNLKTFVALYEGRTVGAVIYIAYKDTVSAWAGAVKSDVDDLSANALIHWEAIKWTIRNGYKWHEIMGANTRNLCEFKSKYSPELGLYFSIKKAKPLGKLAEKLYLLYITRRW